MSSRRHLSTHLATFAATLGVLATALGAGQGSALAHDSRTFDQRHAAWTSLLRRYDREGVVDYAGLKRDGRGALSAYLSTLASVPPERFVAWTPQERIAFWIDAYNAFTVQRVVDHYPLRSIREIGLLPFAAFREHVIPIRLLGARALSLQEIEDHLRKAFADPRIHFALVCASKSCPSLRSEAYRGTELDQQLDDQARRFLSNPAKNRFEWATQTLYLSKLFDWYREDFVSTAGSVPAFVARYAAPAYRAAVVAPGVRVAFLDYDWSLNGR